MKGKGIGCALFCLILVGSKKSFGQELELPKTEVFQAYIDDQKRIQDEKIEVFVPLNIQPTYSQSGLYQQIFDHQLQQMRAYGMPVQNLQKWNGQLNLDTKPNPNPQRGEVSFQFQPITTQATMNVQDFGKFSVNHQIFLHQTEYRLSPARSRWSLSHINNPEESKERVMWGIDW